MTADLMPFEYRGELVRTIAQVGGPWFVLADLCRVLGLGNPSEVATRIDPDALSSTEVIDSMGRPQRARIVNEPGMYEVVLMSRKPEARAFKRWITHDVLPAIRRTGSYSVTPQLQGAELLARAVLEAQSMLAAKDERIAELEPKADLADTYLNADSADRLVAQAAKLLRQKEKDLRRFLIEERLVFVRHSKCGVVQYEPYAEYSAHFAVHETVVNHTWGACSHFTLRIRPRGIDLIRKRLAQTQLQPA